MLNTQGFSPRWASPPGDTVRDVLDEQGVSVEQFASMIGLTRSAVDALLESSEPISIELARRLADSIGSTVEFWVTRDCQYRDDLARVEADRWMRTLPIHQMSSFGWIRPQSDWQERLSECLGFFDVPDVDAWKSRYGSLVHEARFRSSKAVHVNPSAVTAWIRQGEIQVADIPCEAWDATEFRNCLHEARTLTRQKDPALSLPALASLCSRAGVAVAAVRPPKESSVGGVARFLGQNRALILLSGRYLSDDHLWFTFFHEAAHLLLHDHSRTYLDDLDPKAARPSPSSEEAEADEFAQNSLVPASILQRLSQKRLSIRQVITAARQIGVAPGIIVGQLQHAGLISYDRFNGLKRRYRWVGTSLERA